MNKKYAPLNDDIETNPDRDYIKGPYSTFDVELSRSAKELSKQYKKLKNFGQDEPDEGLKKVKEAFAKNMKVQYKKAAQTLVANKMVANKDAVIKYFQSLRTNIMSAILNNEILLDYALRFKDLWMYEKEHFLTVLDRVLSNVYNMEYSHANYRKDNEKSGMAFSARGKNENRATTISFYTDVDSLDKFIEAFAHEFSHKITSETPNMGPLGAQAAHIGNVFYIPDAEDREGYYANADEILSYTVEKAVANDFEKELKARLIQRENIKNFEK